MTFHVRLISPPSQTSGLVAALTSEAGVSNLVVLPGTAQRLGGDAVQFDVAPRSANAVFRQLKALRDDRSGAVAIDYVDAALGGEAAPVSKHFLVQRDIAPVWEVVEAKIRSDAVYAPSFYRRPHWRGRHPHQLPDPHRRRHGRRAGIQRDHGCGARHRQKNEAAGAPRNPCPARRILGSHGRHSALRAGARLGGRPFSCS